MAFYRGKIFFDLDGIYNVQNDRVWTFNRKEADKQGGIYEKTKFPTKVMVWLRMTKKKRSSC